MVEETSFPPARGGMTPRPLAEEEGGTAARGFCCGHDGRDARKPASAEAAGARMSEASDSGADGACEAKDEDSSPPRDVTAATEAWPSFSADKSAGGARREDTLVNRLPPVVLLPLLLLFIDRTTLPLMPLAPDEALEASRRGEV